MVRRAARRSCLFFVPIKTAKSLCANETFVYVCDTKQTKQCFTPYNNASKSHVTLPSGSSHITAQTQPLLSKFQPLPTLLSW